MSIVRATKAALLASVFSIPFGFSAHAADLIMMSPEPVQDQYVDLVLPAVSDINGKLELDFGAITDPDNATFRAAGSLSVPIGERFGVQGDVSIGNIDDTWSFGGALHAFTRDPSSYLLGVTAGVVFADGSRLAAVGPEAELYLDRISLEGWAGWAAIDYDDILMPDESGFFAIGDIAYYPTDDWRISLGGASILGRELLKLATEYQFSGLGFPLSGVGEVRAYDTGSLQLPRRHQGLPPAIRTRASSTATARTTRRTARWTCSAQRGICLRRRRMSRKNPRSTARAAILGEQSGTASCAFRSTTSRRSKIGLPPGPLVDVFDVLARRVSGYFGHRGRTALRRRRNRLSRKTASAVAVSGCILPIDRHVAHLE